MWHHQRVSRPMSGEKVEEVTAFKLHCSLKPTRLIITLIFFQAQDLDPWQIPIKKISPTTNYNHKDMQKTSVIEFVFVVVVVD
jgi:hypothetical protein